MMGYKTPVTLIGGGTVARSDLDLAVSYAPNLIGVDHGANAALGVGHIPSAILGDLDSVQLSPEIDPAIVTQIAEQDTTDFDKALRCVRAPFMIAVGFTGKRTDHELAVYHSLVKHPDCRVIVMGQIDIVMHLSSPLCLDLPVGTRVSLFPLRAVTARASGLRWPIDDIQFDPATQIGTSNEMQDTRLDIAPNGPGLLLILPRRHLDVLCAALAAKP